MLPYEARESPLPIVDGQLLARRTDHGTDLPDHIGHGAFLFGYKRTIALYQKPIAFATDDAVQHMTALMAEKDHIHGLQFGLGTGV